MKRLKLRFAALSAALVLGVVAVGQTLRSKDTKEPQTPAAVPSEQGSPVPLPIASDDGSNPIPRPYHVPSPTETVMRGNDETSRFEGGPPSLRRSPAEAQTPAEVRPPADRFAQGGSGDRYGLMDATRTALDDHQPGSARPAPTGTRFADTAGTGTLRAGKAANGGGPAAANANTGYLSDAATDNARVRPASADTDNMVAQAPQYGGQIQGNRFAPPADNRFSAPVRSPAAQPAAAQPAVAQPNTVDPRYGGAVTEPAPTRPPPTFQSRPAPATLPSSGFRPDSVGVGSVNSARTIVDPRTPGRALSSSGTEIYRAEGKGVPGSRQLEGLQTPAISIEKLAPEEVQVNKPATFEIHVRNVGKTVAHNVQVHDEIPQGTRLIDASPQFSTSTGAKLSWNIGTLQAGEESIVALQLLPLTEGELGSVAHVTFQAEASARTICTRPQLTVDLGVPQKVLIDEKVVLSITLSNPGSGAATGVIIEEDVPEGLTHPAGGELEYEVGTLRAGESKRLELELVADKAGVVNNVLVVRADGNLEAKKSATIQVLAPELQVRLVGPRVRYLERQATYTVSVSNPGTATAKDVELVAWLPKGLKFITTENKGQYDPKRHAVFWSLEELPPTTTGAVQLTALPIEIGQQKLRVESRADRGLTTEHELEINVDGLAELMFTIADKADPIEVGAENIYEIRLTNNGSKADTNIRLTAELPDGLRPISGDGPTRGAVRGNRIIFDPLPNLQPKDEVVYRVVAKGERRGVQVVRAIIASDQAETPVTKEESTRVYADE